MTMDTLGNENIRSAFETGQGSDSNGEIRKRTKLLKNVMIAAAVIVLAVAGTGYILQLRHNQKQGGQEKLQYLRS